MSKLQRGKEILKNLADLHTGQEAKSYMNDARSTQRMGHLLKSRGLEDTSAFDEKAKDLKDKARRSQRIGKNLRRGEAVAGGTAAAGAGGYAAYKYRKGQSNETT